MSAVIEAEGEHEEARFPPRSRHRFGKSPFAVFSGMLDATGPAANSLGVVEVAAQLFADSALDLVPVFVAVVPVAGVVDVKGVVVQAGEDIVAEELAEVRFPPPNQSHQTHPEGSRPALQQHSRRAEVSRS